MTADISVNEGTERAFIDDLAPGEVIRLDTPQVASVMRLLSSTIIITMASLVMTSPAAMWNQRFIRTPITDDLNG